MKTVAVAGVIPGAVPLPSRLVAGSRVIFLDNLRYLMVVLVVLYHSVAAYAAVAPHWAVHDVSTFGADIIRELFDVFMMPVLFFVSGYLALVSLQKKTVWQFLADKVRRLLIPWALAILFILPLGIYDQPIKPIRPFWKYWLSYLSSFETQLRFTQAPVGPSTQAVYWFVSLLFAFCLVFALGYAFVRYLRGAARPSVERQAPSMQSVTATLLVFGVLTSAAYFVFLQLVPDSSWFTLGMFLEFQVTRLIPYAGCFALGAYAQSRGWLVDSKPLGPIGLWSVASLLLAVAYLVVGQPMFADTAGTASFSTGYLMVFAVLRSFLVLSLLVTFVSFGIRFWNSANGFDRQLAAASYNIYLVHLFVVGALQTALLRWSSGPLAIKIGIVFLAALALSYAISRWILARHSRAFAVAMLALFAFCMVIRP